MKKSYQKIIFLLISIVAVSTLSGCTSDKKVKNYLQALLDASYKNDAAIFVDMKLGSEEEAQELYERGIDTGVGVFCSKLGVPDAYRESFRQVYMDMLGKVRYTVDTAEKQSDGSYVVTVTYEKMNILKPALERYQEAVAALAASWQDAEEPPAEEALAESVYMEFRNSMESVLSEVQYDEAATMTVRIELLENIYTPNTEDIAELEKALFDGE